MKRREFFGVVGGAGVATLLPSIAEGLPQSDSVKPTLEGLTDDGMAEFLSNQTDIQRINFDGLAFRKWLNIYKPRIGRWPHGPGDEVLVFFKRQKDRFSCTPSPTAKDGGKEGGAARKIVLRPGSSDSVYMIKISTRTKPFPHVQTFWRLDNGWFTFGAPWHKRKDRVEIVAGDPDIIDGRVDGFLF